jgi:predicted dehydrogenase
MSDKRLRVALIGAGMWGQRAHLPALMTCDDVEVVALYHYRLEPLRAVAERFGINHIYADVEALFTEADDLDAVVISTPTDTHRDFVLAAADAGVHILCEKPIAYNVAQGQEMVDAVRSRGLVSEIGFIFRFSPVLQRMKQLVDEGYIGDLQMFESVGGNEQFIDAQKPLHWKMLRERADGGVFVEYGTHHIDLAIWFGGPITSVVAHGLTLVPERPTRDGGRAQIETDDACSWIATYQSGGQALFKTYWAALPVGASGIRLHGTRGSLAQHMDPRGRRQEQLVAATIDEPEPRVLFEFAPSFDPQFDSGDFALGLLGRYNVRLVKTFVDDIHKGHITGASFEDALAAQRVLAAIRTSLDERRWVDVDTE